jgi:signal transduction histidine kinase
VSHRPWKRTVRVRLTLLYTGLFLVTSVVLLTVVNLLLNGTLQRRVADIAARPIPDPRPPEPPFRPEPFRPGSRFVGEVIQLPGEVLEYQWTVTAITIGVLTVVSVATGWWLAGRLLRPLLARLERSVDSHRRFIANAAHELRTPLATQRAAIQIGLDGPLAGDLAQVRETLLVNNRRTERLIDSLLVLAQAEHGLDTTQPVALDVLVGQAADEAADTDISVTVHTRPATVRGDPVLLNRLLTNLVQNAVRYNRPNGSVHIGLTAAGELTVRNTGPDVPADRIPELFQPFRRLHTRTRTADGAGLGLSIVASIAEAHHATVAARPNPGGGLVLTVSFPALVPA